MDQNIAQISDRREPAARVSICGLPFDNLSMARAAKVCARETLARVQARQNLERVRARQNLARVSAREICSRCDSSFIVVTPGIETSIRALRDLRLKRAIERASLSVCDGIGVYALSLLLGRPLKARIPGIDLFCSLLPFFEKRSVRLFLYGARPGIAGRAAEKLTEKYPSLTVCGTLDGYGDRSAAAEHIMSARPDVLVVCLGSPVQENFALSLDRLYARSPCALPPVIFCLGGTLDVLSGSVKRAPALLRRLGLEWAWRIACDPKRALRLLK